jgi:RNA polymerase sigma-70 factor (ECF subfamily)
MATVKVVEPVVSLLVPPASSVAATPFDAETSEWLRSLRAEDGTREAAIARLHAVLLRAARFEVARRRSTLPHLRGNELDDIANEAADDALMSVHWRLDDFRGASRFTTWAYKFALLEAAVKLRRRAWQGREIPLADDAWAALASAASAERRAEDSELFAAIRDEIEALSLRQREVMIAVAINDVPIDVLAERLGATRGALYKTLHDARRKLRGRLAARGLWPDDGGEENP